MKICGCLKEFIPDDFGLGSVMCASCRSNRNRWTMKLRCIKHLGGKCELCNYDKCPEALDFHHRDPSTKSFTISGRMSRSWDVLRPEVEKCMLLCANCHRETHWKERTDKNALVYDEPAIRKISKKAARKLEIYNDRVEASLINPRIKLIGNGKINWPSNDELHELVITSSFVSAANVLGVSDSAIRKHLRRQGIDPKSIRSRKDNGKKTHAPLAQPGRAIA